MKKLLALLLALALCASLCACGEEKAAEPSGPRSDLSATPIPKPDAAGQKTDAPAATPAPTEAPAPAVPIEVGNYCDIAGVHAMVDNGSSEYFSFVLPEVSGPDTDYLRALNEAVEDIYDEYVEPALDAMEEQDDLPRYCTCYQYAVNDGIHSLFITCDSDWGEDLYWCFNFDDAGNEVKNADILKAAGMAETVFVKSVRGFFTDMTDLAEYFEDDGWKELQEKTIADDNCNADLPMVLLPNGNLCFIGTIYTPAGAGVYDYALEFTDDGEIALAATGRILLNRLGGSYLVDSAGAGLEDDDASYFLSFFSVGDTLSVEVTGFDRETGSPYFYYAADIIPEDPADLLRADIDSLRVSVLPYCQDAFGGSYYGEPGIYTMTVGSGSVSFTDFEGGTPLLGGADGFTAWYDYPEDYGLDDPIPDPDYENIDYDALYNSGLPGLWSGTYTDEDYQTHSLTLELTSWGKLKLRDCVDGQIPRVLEGGYYCTTEAGEYPADAVVFNVVSRAGYKMPVSGCCYMFLDDDGALLIDEELDGWYDKLTQVDYENYYCVLYRVPAVRYRTEPEVLRLEENAAVSIDIDLDGTDETIACSFTRDKDAGDTITQVTIALNGEEYPLGDQWLYDAEAWLVRPALSGQAFLFIDGVSDNDAHYLQIIGVDATNVWYVGDYFGGFAEDPTDANALRLGTRIQLLSTAGGARAYRLSAGGMPEAIEPFFYPAGGGLTLTAKQDLDVWVVDPDTGELIDTTTLPAKTKVSLLRTDGSSFWDLLLKNGDVRRVWIDDSDWPQSIDGVDIEDCFDGIRFAG